MTNKNQQIGGLIAAIRKEKGLTQAQLGEMLHVTGKAVSKWELGQSAPGVDLLEKLADILGITVTELLAGRRMEQQDVQTVAQSMALELLRRERRTFYRTAALVALSVLLALTLALRLWGPTVFQEGDPRPYLSAMIQLRDRPYAKVRTTGGSDVYLTRREDGGAGRAALFALVENSREVFFVQQAGSAYLFTNGVDNLAVSSRIYWRNYVVWQVPTHTLEK